eukprot:2328349-Pleurochrysis_carterae.AAC.1
MGELTMFYVGGFAGRCEYFAAGPALQECFEAGDIASKGNVVISATIWAAIEWCGASSEMSNGYRLLHSIRQVVRKRSLYRAAPPASALARASAEAVLRAYAPPVILESAAMEAALGRSVRGWTVNVVQVSVVFIHFGVAGLMDPLALDCTMMHAAVVAVQKQVHITEGCIHRFTVDDKGCVMKVIFGGEWPHEKQPYRAVLAAMLIHHELIMQGIQPAIGVASGEGLAGPVGGAVRQEFTVHGERVVLAARLMQLAAKLGGMVLCDEATKVRVGSDVRFVQLRPTSLKGKSAPIVPYRPIATTELTQMAPSMALPPELYVETEAARLALTYCSDWMRQGAQAETQLHGLLIHSACGSGKTQLLMQLRDRLEPSCRTVHVVCQAHEQQQQGAMLRRLLGQLCAFDVWPSLIHLMPLLKAAGAGREASSGKESERWVRSGSEGSHAAPWEASEKELTGSELQLFLQLVKTQPHSKAHPSPT